jgi:hypothetical protein
MIQIGCYEVTDESNPHERKADSIIDLIECGMLEYKEKLLPQSDVILQKAWTLIQENISCNLDVAISVFVVPWDILSMYGNELKDGFVYKLDDYRIVISKDTEFKSVFIHELCHVLMDIVMPESRKWKTIELEKKVTDLENYFDIG